jgi:hypothetical protein
MPARRRTLPATQRRHPLVVLSGASGAGKSTIVPLLIERLAGTCAVFDVDWLIDPLREAAPDRSVAWDAFRDTWLHVAAGLAQNRLPTVLVGPYIPDHLETLPGRELVGEIVYGVLDCSDDVRRTRIEARPSWRLRDIDEQVAFGAWLRTNLAPVFDTDSVIPEKTADAVAGWVRELLPDTDRRSASGGSVATGQDRAGDDPRSSSE